MTWQRRARVSAHFSPRTGAPRARPTPRAGRSRLSPGRACGVSESGAGEAPGQTRARWGEDRGGKGVKTRCRLLEGLSRAPCAPPGPDSLGLPPAAAPVGSTEGPAPLKSPQVPRRRSPVPSGCRRCRGGCGSPPQAGGGAALPVPALGTRSVAAPPPRLGPARQRSESSSGPASPLPERRSRPAVPAAPPGQAPAGKPGGRVQAEPGTAMGAAPLLAELRHGHPGSVCAFCLSVGCFGIWGGPFLVTGVMN